MKRNVILETVVGRRRQVF